jgi:hypothetical protein
VDANAVGESEVKQLAALVGLSIDPLDLPNVVVALRVLLGAAALVREFALADDVEAAPVFRP